MVSAFREGSPVFGLLATGCFLAAFVEYCFGVGARPFDLTGLTILGLVFLSAHIVWMDVWRRT
jgi:hypothetical protein